eukprot:GFKZ01012312.1.p1 GENE.GFKZ01012312.1~~GFKZ01012312.1.p1  ORF type:complete len:1084 (+),score=88.59 GFKZ01012312.1:233-3484(+)
MDPHPLSSSLPSHFRLRPSFDFFTTSHLDDPLAPSVHTSRPRTRLEVLHGWEVNFTVLSLYAVSTFALIYVVLNLHALQSTWSSTNTVPPLSVLEQVLRLFINAASVVLALFFVCNLALYSDVTHEQAWTCVLLVIGLAVDNPFTAVGRTSDGATIRRGFLVWNDAVYTSAIYLYLILAAHSYRVFDPSNIRTFRFYVPKLAATLGYMVVKLAAGFGADVSLGLVPFARVLSWVFLQASGRGGWRVGGPVLAITVLDLGFAVWILREVHATAAVLGTVPYVENRSKQLGFRCFVYQTLTFCVNMVGLSLLIVWLTPRGFLERSFDDPHGHFFQLEPPVARLALACVYFTWTLVLAYVNMPPRPLMMAMAQRVMNWAIGLVRNRRLAVWMGLADLVTAEDEEDSSDDEELIVVTQEAEGGKPTFPFRYRHRELYDDMVLSPDYVSPIAPLGVDHVAPRMDSVFGGGRGISGEFVAGRWDIGGGVHRENSEGTFDAGSAEDSPPLQSQPWNIPSRFPATDSPWRLARQEASVPVDIPSPHIQVGIEPDCRDNPLLMSPAGGIAIGQRHRMLRMRKHLFVMETQIMMANAAYLSYIPGNLNEERIPPCRTQIIRERSILHTGSLASDLDDLGRQIKAENEALTGVRSAPSLAEMINFQPDYDDGSMFRVDPYEMAERYGYKIYRHFSNEELNTHAIVLTSASRIIVAFSGTRDVTNWGVNANINRVVLDDKLSRFEYELSTSPSLTDGDHSDMDDEDYFDSSTYEMAGSHARDHSSISSQTGKLRRSRSEEDTRSYAGSDLASDVLIVRSRSAKDYGSIDSRSKASRIWGGMDESNLHGLITQNGVTRMAKTFARELMTFGQAKVHEGFINAYMSLRKQVMGALVELYRGRRRRGSGSTIRGRHANRQASALPLFFCGHSMGGALATFASYEAARYYKRIGLESRHSISCTTFGCPRLGNEAFKARYERLVETHWRFEIASDPIPKVPLVLLNYVHVGVQVLIDQSGVLLIDPSFIEVQWWGRMANLYLGYRLHLRASYCMALRTYCKLYRNGADDLADRFWPFPIRIQTKGLFHLANRPVQSELN